MYFAGYYGIIMSKDNGRIKKLKWCIASKNGVQLVEPSENLAKAYMMKSRESIRSMEINVKAGIKDWSISTSYYARYFAVYALFSRIGIKSEIHDCTISLFEYLFDDSFPEELIKELKLSKENRIEAQYYTEEVYIDVEAITERTKKFVLEIESLLDKINSIKIRKLRAEVETIKG